LAMRLDSWPAVEAEIESIVSKSKEPFAPNTIENVRDFVSFARENCPVPDVGKGYWSTICFTWEATPSIEVEVFGNRFEVHRFPDDGSIDIRYVDHTPGTPFPPDLAADLPRKI